MNKQYNIRFGNGAPDEKSEGSVFQLLSEIPYLLTDGYVLSKIVVNSILSKGIEDSGMSGGCEWQPFQLDETEYKALLKEFQDKGFKTIECPEWIVDRETWIVHVFEMKHGIPHEVHPEIIRKIEDIEKQLKQAMDEEKEELEGNYMLELVRADDELNNLYNNRMKS